MFFMVLNTILKIKAFECFELGRIAYENSDFYHTILWMNEALERINKENVNFSKSGVDKVAILDYLSYALAKVLFILFDSNDVSMKIFVFLFQARKFSSRIITNK